MKIKELKPIKEESNDYYEIEQAILKLFKSEIYLPLLRELGYDIQTLKNSRDDLISAIQSGKLTFYRGRFTGRFNSTLSRELRSIGAEWDRKQGCYVVPQSKLPIDVRQAVSLSATKFEQTLERITSRLREISPSAIAQQLDLTKMFDSLIWKTEKKLKRSMENITVSPKLSSEEAQRIAEEYTTNMQLHIRDWTEKEIVELREQVQKHTQSGLRYEGLAKEIQKSYGVSYGKAKFLARQETSLLVTKFKQTRYEDAGVDEYKWACVVGSAAHPVRPMHKIHQGKTFSWKNPPVVNEEGDRKNPGQDYNCRCFAIPIVRF